MIAHLDAEGGKELGSYGSYHVVDACGAVVKGHHGGDDAHPGQGGKACQVAQVDGRKGGFASSQHERAAFLDGHVGSAQDLPS